MRGSSGRYELQEGEGLFLDLPSLSRVQIRVEEGSVAFRGTLLPCRRSVDIVGGPFFLSCIEQPGKSPVVVHAMLWGEEQSVQPGVSAKSASLAGVPDSMAFVFRESAFQNGMFEIAGFASRAYQLGCQALLLVTGHADLAPHEAARSLAALGHRLGSNVLLASLDPLVQPIGNYGCLNAALLQSEDFASFSCDVGLYLSIPLPLALFSEAGPAASSLAFSQTGYSSRGGRWAETSAPPVEARLLDQLGTQAIRLIAGHWNLYLGALRALLVRLFKKAEFLSQFNDYTESLQVVLLLPPHNNTVAERAVVSNIIKECTSMVPTSMLGGLASSPAEASARRPEDLDAIFGSAHHYGDSCIRIRGRELGACDDEQVDEKVPQRVTEGHEIQSRLEILWYSTPRYLPLVVHAGASFLRPPMYSTTLPWEGNGADAEEGGEPGDRGEGDGRSEREGSVASSGSGTGGSAVSAAAPNSGAAPSRAPGGPLEAEQGSGAIKAPQDATKEGGPVDGKPLFSKESLAGPFFVPIVELQGRPQTPPLDPRPLFQRAVANYFHGPAGSLSPVVVVFQLSSRLGSSAPNADSPSKEDIRRAVVLEVVHNRENVFADFMMGGERAVGDLQSTPNAAHGGLASAAQDGNQSRGPSSSFRVLSDLVEQPYAGLINTLLLILEWGAMDSDDVTADMTAEEFRALMEGEDRVPFVLRSSVVGLGIVRSVGYEDGVHTFKVLMPRVPDSSKGIVFASTGLLVE